MLLDIERIEAAAKALFEMQHGIAPDVDWEDADEHTKGYWRRQARSAVSAWLEAGGIDPHNRCEHDIRCTECGYWVPLPVGVKSDEEAHSSLVQQRAEILKDEFGETSPHLLGDPREW